MIVVDTPVIVYYYLPGDHTKDAERLLCRDHDWVTSWLWRFEFRNVVAEYIRKQLIDPIAAVRIAEEAEMRFRGREYSCPATRIIDLITKSKCTAYDLEYVGIAQELGVDLVTTDKEVIRTFPSIAKNMRSY